MKNTFRLKAAALLLCTFIYGVGGLRAQEKDCLHSIQIATGIPEGNWYSITSGTGSLTNPISPTSSAIDFYFGSTGVVSNKVFFVAEDLVINSTITFQSCRFYLMPNVKIIVLSPNSFIANTQSYFAAACERMWHGITIEDGGTGATVNLENDTLRDMEYGVFLKGYNHVLHAKLNSFLDNRISMHIEKTSASYSGTIFNNRFCTSTNLINPWPGQPAEIGIEVVNCLKLNIGDATATGYGNEFFNMRCGVYLNDNLSTTHTVTISDGIFHHISGAYGNNLFSDYLGACIYGVAANPGFKVIVKSNNVLGNSSFASSNKGIILDNVGADVRLVSMTSVPIGIATDKEGNTIVVDHCSFSSVFWAIRVYMTPGASSFTDNYISTLSGLDMTFWPLGLFRYPRGIYLQNQTAVNPTVSNPISITGNTILMKADQGTAIEQRGPCGGLETSHNTIYLQPTNSYVTSTAVSTSNLFAGIYCVANQNGTTIKSNRIEGNAATHYYFASGLSNNLNTNSTANVFEPTGITLFGARPFIECNHLINMRYGIQALENSGGGGSINATRVKGNWLKDNCVGILCQRTGTIAQGLGNNIGSASYDNDNQFITIGTPGSTSWEVLNGNNVKVYFNDGSVPATQRRLWTSSATISFLESIGSPAGAAYVVTTPTVSPVNTYACSTNYQVPLRKTTSGSYGPDDVTLFEAIARGQNPDGGSGNAVPWLQAKELYNFIEDHPELAGVSAILDSFQSATTGGVFGQMRDAELAYAQLADSSVRSDSASYASAIAQAQSANNSINPSNEFETKVQWMTRLRLSYIQHGVDSFASADTAMISYLAHACPSDEGTAAEIGAYLYQTAIAPENFEGQTLCGVSGNTLRKTRRENTAYRLYPNPANTQIFVEALSGAQLEGQGRISISNMIGQQVFNQHLALDSQPTSIDISAVQSGVYYYQLHSAKGIVQSGKLIINH